jgi:hypothetical protein
LHGEQTGHRSHHPNESVGAVTTILASMWRSMPTEEKMAYVEFAEQFDLTQAYAGKMPKPPPTPLPKSELVIPLIHVVRRNASSGSVQEASLHFLDRAIEDGLHLRAVVV